MLPSLSGEVWVQGLEEALQFDRESFREDHSAFRFLRDQLTEMISDETADFRKRSAKRTKKQKEDKPPKPAQKAGTTKPTDTASGGQTPLATSYPTESYLPATIFDGQKPYIIRLIPQINGCFGSGYFEACAMLCRRLIETMIIDLYDQKGWSHELKDSVSKDYFGLKTLVNKISSDPRFGFDSKIQKGLNSVKDTPRRR
jgi:hypothetical protein